MPIYRDRERGAFVFDFSRRINGRRIRAQKILPKAWNQAQADAFDRKESARIYALAQQVGGAEHTIDQAVDCFLRERLPSLKNAKSCARELAAMLPFYEGRPLSALPDVCKTYRLKATRTPKRVLERGEKLEPLAAATIRNRIRYLTSACRFAWKFHSMGDHDPAEKVAVPSVNNARTAFLTRAEMIMLARACEDRPTRAAIRIAFYSGMRADEIRRAEVIGTAFVLRDTKNGNPRIIPIHPRLFVCLKLRAEIGVHRQRYHFDKARAKVKMPWLHFHDLRHAAASAMINQGIDLYTVGAVLGHKSPQSTKRYAHLATTALSAAIHTIGRKAA